MKHFVSFNILSILLSILLLPTLVQPALANTPPTHPGEVVVETEHLVPAEDFDLDEGKYVYSVDWQGIPVATAWIDVKRDEGKVYVDAGAETNSVIALLYELQYEAKGFLNGTTLKPDLMTIRQSENSRRKFTRITFDRGNIHSEVARLDKDKRDVLDFQSKNFTLGPMSGALLARSLNWEVGQSRKFDIFNGKSRYLVTFTCDRLDTIEVLGKKTKVYVFKPKVFNLTKGGLANKLRQAEIFVTADSKREVVNIESEVFIGTVSARLSKFVPSKLDRTVAAAESTKKKG